MGEGVSQVCSADCPKPLPSPELANCSPIHSEDGVRAAVIISPLEPGACKNASRWMRTTGSSVITSSGSCSAPDRAQKSLSRFNEAGQEMDGNSHGLTRAAWHTIYLSPDPQAGGTPQLDDFYKCPVLQSSRAGSHLHLRGEGERQWSGFQTVGALAWGQWAHRHQPP